MEEYWLLLKNGKKRKARLLKNDLLTERVYQLKRDNSIVFECDVEEARETVDLDMVFVLSYLLFYMNI